MIEDLCVVGTLCQSVEPHADCVIAVSLPDVEVGQSISQSTGLRTELQQRLTQSDALIISADQRAEKQTTVTENRFDL